MTKKIEKIFTLSDGLNKAHTDIENLLTDRVNPLIVLVAGWTASWKTSRVAEKIAWFFEGSQILSMDNYYRGHNFMDEQKQLWNELNWDQPEALDLDLFKKHLSELQNGNSIFAPTYDFQTEPVFHAQKIDPSSVIIVEGLFALHESLEALWDYNIYVDIGSHWQILRRIFRDIHRTGDTPKQILDYFLEVVEPMHSKYIEPTKKSANIIVSNDYNPNIEAKNSEVKESNLKFELQEDLILKLDEIIYKLWWNYVWEVEQNDRYFNPTQRKLSEKDEFVRIRKLWKEKLLFSYIWPDLELSAYEKRFHLRFFIDEATYQSFKHVYKNRIKEIKKTRKSYYISWILVSIDYFDNGKMFLVLRFDDTFTRLDALKILEHLWIDPLSGLHNVYFNLLK